MREKRFGAAWEDAVPIPVCEDRPEYLGFYKKAWALAYAHIRDIPGMPQTPYMDEAFCDTQIWIWDTCFMSLFCKYARGVFPGVESLKNFYEVLHGAGRLPKIVPGEREPDWTGATPGVPADIKIHIADNPPLFALAEYENALMSGDLAHIRELLYESGVLQKHYEWIEGLSEQVLPRGVLNETYLIHEDCGYRWEGGRSGMDNTPRGRRGARAEAERPNNPDMLWLDAICQQALSAKRIAALFAIVGDEAERDRWLAKYEEKKAIVNRLYLDGEERFYYDIDRFTHAHCKVATVASYWALTAGIADMETARNMAAHIYNEQTFGGPVPLVSLARNDADFDTDGLYWRGSLWLPTAYAALLGFREYGLLAEAQSAGQRILDHMLKTYETFEPHTIWECYAPNAPRPATVAEGTGELVRKDFCGWSALGAISVYIEFVLGFHTVNAFENTVDWARPKGFEKAVGIKNLRFGEVVTDIVAEGALCTVVSNAPYTLRIDGKPFAIQIGTNKIKL